jgi:enamine deaminase RidA (YjgF/YER057c/UK114 family)
MSDRLNIPSNALWEDIVGYSRVVRIGNIVEVSGTASIDENNNIIGEDNPAEQAKFIINKISKALKEAGAELTDVIRTRIFVTDISKWKEIGKVHGEFFKDIKPATSMIEVKALIRPEFLLEIEATAVIK